MSFKIWNAATHRRQCLHVVARRGDDLADTRPSRAYCTLWPREGEPREMSVVDFVTGNHRNVLRKGELLRSIRLPAARIKRAGMRQVSLTKFGRSAALIIATVGDDGTDFLLTISASTPRPVQLRFATCPSAHELRQAVDARLPLGAYFDDVHGSAPYKRHVSTISPNRSVRSSR